jgi:hypothetical protein
LLQWPVEEVESLRGEQVSHQGLELKQGDLFEIKGIDTLQASFSCTHTCLLNLPNNPLFLLKLDATTTTVWYVFF